MNSLHCGKVFSLEQLRNELGLTSERQARRIIKKLQEANAPIEEVFENRKKYFYIREDKQQRPNRHTLTFSREEIQALSIAIQAARAALEPTPLLTPLSSAFATLLDSFEDKTISVDAMEKQRWHFGSSPSVTLNHKVFTALREAASEELSVRVDYTTASTGIQSKNRKVDPYSLTLRGTTWILVAFCHERKELRDFAIADISNVRLCDPEKDYPADFKIPDDFDINLHFRDRFNALASGAIYEVRLLVEPDRAPYFRRKMYHPTQQIEETQEDGRLVVSYEVAGLNEIRSFVQSWGVGVTVLEPEELVRKIKAETEVLTQRYRSSDGIKKK